MGVLGLWQLLQPTGQPISLDSLSGKVLAVDISMWLHQSSKGMRDRQGNPVPNAHLVGLFRRMCKLLFYHVKPIVVFDGGAPILKKQTLNNRRQNRELAASNSNRSSKKLISKLLKYHAINSAVGSTSGAPDASSQSTTSDARAWSKDTARSQEGPDMFQLPPIPTSQPSADTNSGDEDNPNTADDAWEEVVERRSRYYEQMKELHKHNINSESFEALPLDVKHEILKDLKDSNKTTDWANICNLPKDSSGFSSFQLNRLIQQNKLTQLLENVRQEMNYSAGGLDSIVEEAGGATVETNRVMSDDTAQYVLIKGGPSQKAIEEASEDTQIQEEEESTSAKKVFRMNESFAIRKIAKDKNAGRKFAPVCVVKLSSSSSSSSEDEEVIKRTKKKKSRVLSPPDSPVAKQETLRVPPESTSLQTAGLRNEVVLNRPLDDKQSAEQVKATVVNQWEYAAHETQSKTQIVPQQALQMVKNDRAIIPEQSLKENESLVGDNQLRITHPLTDSQNDKKTVGVKVEAACEIFSTSQSKPALNPVINNSKLQSNDESVEKSELLERNKETGELCYYEKLPVTAVSVRLDPSIISVDDDLFPASIFEMTTQNDEDLCNQPLMERNLAADLNEIDLVPDFQIDQADDNERDFENPFVGISKDGLVDMQHDLAAEAKELQSEKGKQERLASGITNQMQIDAQELLQLFGVPYLVSPMEAEAQCAYLDLTDQTNGTITDDSDVWLFGGRRVYRNLFNQDRDVELYTIDDIETVLDYEDTEGLMMDVWNGPLRPKHKRTSSFDVALNASTLDRHLLINIALLCGSDYTEGMPGVGPITALELFTEFSGDGFEKLINFAEWWRENKGKDVKQTKLRSRLQQLKLRDGFPSRTVADAYLQPTVDESKESFTWSEPNIEGLREYARSKLFWGRGTTDELLVPMIKRRNKAIEVQTQLTNYFKGEHKALGKRLQQVVNKLRGKVAGSVQLQKRNKRRKKNRKLANGGSSGESCSGTETSNSENEGGFIRKRASGRRIIQSDDEISESEVTATVNDDISDSEMADIDLDYI